MKSKPHIDAIRSATMRAVKSRGNKSTELKLRMLFIRNRITGWTLNNENILGKPDFWFKNKKKAVFVDGCFWHGCMCRTHIPHANKSYWKRKIVNNIKRDQEINSQLTQKGIKILRLWEHDVLHLETLTTGLQNFLSME